MYEWHSMWTDGSYADEFRDKEVMFVCTYNDEKKPYKRKE